MARESAPDAMVITADPVLAFPELLNRRGPQLTLSPSCVLMLAGVRGTGGTDAAGAGAHHNVHFGDAWRRTFAELMDEGTTMTDPRSWSASPHCRTRRWPLTENMATTSTSRRHRESPRSIRRASPA